MFLSTLIAASFSFFYIGTSGSPQMSDITNTNFTGFTHVGALYNFNLTFEDNYDSGYRLYYNSEPLFYLHIDSYPSTLTYNITYGNDTEWNFDFTLDFYNLNSISMRHTAQFSLAYTTGAYNSFDFVCPSQSVYEDFQLYVSISCYLYDYDTYQRLISTSTSPESYGAGYTDGYANGYDTGYDDGHLNGYTDGRNTGYDMGYDDGVSQGYTHGYQTGYETAMETHDFTFTNLFASIADTPVLIIRRLFGFELFGTSLIAVFMSLFTALIVIHLIKKVF